MPRHVSLTPRDENLLRTFIGKQIVDVLGRESEGRPDDETGRVITTDAGVVSEDGQKV